MTDPIEELLAQMKAQYGEADPPAKSSASQPNDPLTAPSSAARPAAPDPTEALLTELKAHYTERDRAEARQQQQQRAIERRQQDELRSQQRSAAAQRAQTWLQQLQPQSGEAIWFEEFAARYPSRLEAAIDYLDGTG